MELAFPTLCAWCGAENPSLLRLITAKETKLTGFYIVAYSTRVRTYQFPLPICEECNADLHRSRRMKTLSSVIGGVVGAIAIAAFLALAGLVDFICVMASILSGVVGAILGAAIGSLVFRPKRWGRIKDGQPEFHNEEFCSAFHALAVDASQENASTRSGSADIGLGTF